MTIKDQKIEFKIIKFLLLIITIFSHTNFFASIEYSSRKYIINISENEYTESTYVKGKILNLAGDLIQVSYTGLEKIEDLSLTYFDRKAKKIKQKDFINSGVETSSFYAGLKSFQFYINTPTHFDLSYNRKGSDLMYLSTLNFNKYFPADTISYEVRMPIEYNFIYNIPYDIDGLKIDSTTSSTNKTYFFKLIKKESSEKNSSSDFLVDNNLAKAIRIQISKSNDPNQVLNAWYMKLIEGVGRLDLTSKKEIDSIIYGLIDNDEIIKKLFNYVQTKIRYLDIEDGISAFKPRNVNDILYKKQGDCKDMANLLTQALLYKGFDAKMALSSSLSHRYNLDFPNIASANHVVCLVNRNNNWIILDATDKYCTYLSPSIHTQDRSVFIIGEEQGVYHFIKKIPYSENLDSSYFNFNFEKEQLKGDINIVKKGLASRTYNSMKDYHNRTQFENWMQNQIKEEFNIFKVDKMHHEVTNDKTSINFLIGQKTPVLTTIKTKHYLPVINLIAYPNQFPQKIKSNERLITYETVYKKGTVRINFNEEINIINKLDFSYTNHQFTFAFTTNIIDSKIIELSYVLIIDEVELKDDSVLKYNELNEVITEIFNKSIVYEKIIR